ncbi:Uncharacterised protein [Mycobacteroides abscessus subsp. abscessus]|nr:Uncharacterised protein [Mycobacteroides abscessus subsp. abscessus]
MVRLPVRSCVRKNAALSTANPTPLPICSMVGRVPEASAIRCSSSPASINGCSGTPNRPTPNPAANTGPAASARFTSPPVRCR